MKNLSFPGLPHILVVDAEEAVRNSLSALLKGEGLAVDTCATMAHATQAMSERCYDLIFVDQALQAADDVSSVVTLRGGEQPADVVVMTGYGQAPSIVENMRKGATDVVEKPFSNDRVLAVVRRCLESRQLQNRLEWQQQRLQSLTATELIGLSPATREVQQRIDQIAQAPDTTVLVQGPNGVGKELVARSIHERSGRRHGPFIVANCALLSESQLEVELFGCEAGVFQGRAKDGKAGLFEQAAGGTLFLDEIAEIDTSMQAKLVKVLQERTFYKVGGAREVHADVRIIASTRRDLRKAVEAGTFRQELFYRLHGMSLVVPPLSERTADIPLLAHYFLDQIARQTGKPLSGFSEDAMEILTEHSWPGNVRELRNTIEHAAIFCRAGTIEERNLPTFTGGVHDGSDAIERNVIVLDAKDRSIRALEGQLVARVLEEAQWNISRAASLLGINRTTLYNKIKVYGLGKRPAGESKIGA